MHGSADANRHSWSDTFGQPEPSVDVFAEPATVVNALTRTVADCLAEPDRRSSQPVAQPGQW